MRSRRFRSRRALHRFTEGGQLRAGRGGDRFEGHRPFSAGDPVRGIDWQVWRRLGSLESRVFSDPAAFPIYLVADASGSMALGEPSKWSRAEALARELARSALEGLHRLQLTLLGTEHAREDGHWLIGPRAQRRVDARLAAIAPAGEAALDVVLHRLAGRGLPRGKVLVLSDFLEPGAGRPGLEALLAAGHETDLFELRDPVDEALPRGGLRCAESGRALRGAVTAERYTQRLAEHRASLADFARAQGLRHLQVEQPEAALRRYFAA